MGKLVSEIAKENAFIPRNRRPNLIHYWPEMGSCRRFLGFLEEMNLSALLFFFSRVTCFPILIIKSYSTLILHLLLFLRFLF